MYFSTASLDRIEMKLQFWLVDSISIPFHLETTPSCYLTALNLILSSPTRFFCSVSLPQVETFRSKSKEKNSAAAIKSNNFFRKKQTNKTNFRRQNVKQSKLGGFRWKGTWRLGRQRGGDRTWKTKRVSSAVARGRARTRRTGITNRTDRIRVKFRRFNNR